MTTHAIRTPLSPVFAVDAVLSAAFGLLLVGFATPLHALSGGGLAPETLRLLGVALIPWSAHNWFTARKVPLDDLNPLVQILGDTLWLVASVLLCVHHWPTFTVVGKLLYAPQIGAVVLILAAKTRAYRAR